MIRLLVVDDQTVITNGVRAMLESNVDITVIGVVNSVEEALNWLKTHPVDVVLSDVEMPSQSGIELLRELALLHPKVKTVMFSVYCHVSMVKEALQNGAKSYLMKSVGKDELIEAIKTVYKGDFYFCIEVKKLLDKHPYLLQKENKDSPFELLSEREYGIFELILREKTNAEIAKILSLSELTVKTHRSNLMRKLGVKNAIGLVKLAVKFGIIS